MNIYCDVIPIFNYLTRTTYLDISVVRDLYSTFQFRNHIKNKLDTKNMMYVTPKRLAPAHRHMFLGGRTLSTIKIHMLIMEVSHFQESKLVYFLEVDHFLEIRGRTFSIVSHKHGHHLM